MHNILLHNTMVSDMVKISPEDQVDLDYFQERLFKGLRFPMKVINLFGGPGTGKSTTASELFAIMKREDIRVELINEYIKSHMYSGRKDAMELQEYIFAKQHLKQHILKGEVDYVVTDCPLLLSNIYAPKDELFEHLEAYVLGTFNRYDNINIFLMRDPNKLYQNYGREQTESEAINKDAEIHRYLEDHNIPFHVVNADALAANTIFETILKHNMKAAWPKSEIYELPKITDSPGDVGDISIDDFFPEVEGWDANAIHPEKPWPREEEPEFPENESFTIPDTICPHCSYPATTRWFGLRAPTCSNGGCPGKI